MVEVGIVKMGKGVTGIGAARQELGRALRARYEHGASLQVLADETGWSYGFIRRVLIEAGASLRGRGGPRGPRPVRNRERSVSDQDGPV